MKTINVFNIQHFSIHDGPGIRSVVFFKGCNLKCRWCHNPESIHKEKEILLYAERCINCGACVKQCPTQAHQFVNMQHIIDKNKCIQCFKCCEECYTDALVSVGEKRKVEEIVDEILRNKGYFEQSNGGVTFSGGECMLQCDGLLTLLKACKSHGIHTAIDTAGNVPWSYFEEVLPWADLVLYDIKAYDTNVHKQCTGVGNERIIENFKRLVNTDVEVIVRIPFVPELNDGEIEAIAAFLANYPHIRVELLPYHKMGSFKYHALEEKEVFTGKMPDPLVVQQIKEKYHFY